jgi:hypothetical protein
VSPSEASAAGRAGCSANNENAGQAALFKAYARGRVALYAYVLGGAAAFAVGAWQHSVAVMAGGPVAVVVLTLVVAAFAANAAAADRFYRSFAAELGMTYAPRSEPLPLTPLLGAGDRRWCEHWMRSEELCLGHFVFEDVERQKGQERVKSRRSFTICVIECEPSLPFFKGLYVRPRRGIFPDGKDWVRHSDSRKIELESAAFTDRYEVRIADDQSETLARQLLSPTLVSWLAQHPLEPCFEAKAGTLVVYVPRELTDAGNLTFLLDAARHVAVRVTRETEEALSRPAA